MALLSSAIVFLLLSLIGSSLCDTQLEVGPLFGQDATLLLQRKNYTEIFSRAVTFLDSIRSEAVCHQVAALDLVKTCEGLDGDHRPPISKDLSQLYESAKIEFTVRLALCELKTAASRIPKDCARFLPSPNACPRDTWWKTSDANDKRMCYWASDRQQIDLCASSLAASAQSWISYSNARQNAMYVCQAVRDSNDKELWISQQRAFMKTNEELVLANEETIERHRTAQAAFDDFLNQFKQGTADHLAAFGRDAQSIIKNLMSAAQSAILQVYRQASEASTTMDDLKEGIHASKTQAEELREDLATMVEDLALSNSQFREAHTRELASIHTQSQELEVAVRGHLAAELASFREYASMMRSDLRQAHHEMMEGIDTTAAKLHEKSLEVEEAFGKIARLASTMTWQGFGIFSFALLAFIAANKILRVMVDETAAHLFSGCFGVCAAILVCLPYDLKSVLREWKSSAYDFVATHELALLFGALTGLGFGLAVVVCCKASRLSKKARSKTYPSVLPTISDPGDQGIPYMPSMAGHTHRIVKV